MSVECLEFVLCLHYVFFMTDTWHFKYCTYISRPALAKRLMFLCGTFFIGWLVGWFGP